MNREELTAMVAIRRKQGEHRASDPALLVLMLMDTEEHDNNYCSALREVLEAFPEINKEELEAELDKYI